jgi:hypothetical protein
MVSSLQVVRAGTVGALVCSVSLFASCQQVLDIKDAELDPLSAAGPTLCETYCDTVASNCTGAVAVYTTNDTCLGFCGHLPVGTAGDEQGDSAECRLTQADNAASTGEPDVHCPIAGPAGGGTCGTNCDAFCTVFQQVCGDSFDQAYPDLAACRTDCQANIPDVGSYDATMSSGDSVQCRLWHLAAASVDPGVHCPHAAGEPPCGP